MPIKHKLNYTFRFLSHWANATRIDVLHSPFVFKLYNTCIKPTGSGEVDALFNRICTYLQLSIANDFSRFEPNQSLLIRIHQSIDLDTWNTILQQIGEHGMIVLEKPHHTTRQFMMQHMWQCNHIHVCIDLFDVCIIMSRQEQAKEYFKLRW